MNVVATLAVARPTATFHTPTFSYILTYDYLTYDGSPSHLGIAEFIDPTGSFFHAQTHIKFHILEELSPNVRESPKSVPLTASDSERRWKSKQPPHKQGNSCFPHSLSFALQKD